MLSSSMYAPAICTTNERLEWSAGLLAPAYGGSNEVQQLFVRMAHDQINCLCTIHHRTTTHCHKPVKIILPSKGDAFFQTITFTKSQLIMHVESVST